MQDLIGARYVNVIVSPWIQLIGFTPFERRVVFLR